MIDVWFIADIHGGHKNILKYRTSFRDKEEHFSTISNNYNRLVKPKDHVYFLGDIAFSVEYLERIAFEWNGAKKVLVMGNHDTDDFTKVNVADYFDEVHGLLKYKEFWLSHAPIHPEELRGRRNIHGHVHNKTIQDNRFVNVSVDNTGFAPVSLEEIRQCSGIFTK
jgi:calcineurin-like phosphoesterase family protein